MKEFWVRWLWRDPDPLCRWASGQMTRHWWSKPAFSAAAYWLVFAAACAVWTVIDVTRAAPWTFLGGVPPLFWLYLVGRYVILLYLALFLGVALRPFFLFEAAGGAGMFRDLSITPLTNRETARLLYWGSFRRSALPALLLLYLTELIVVILLWPNVRGFLASAGGPGGGKAFPAAVAFLWLVLKPPLDHLMNLAISWRYYWKSRSRYWGIAQAGFWIAIRFPALMILLLLLFLPGFASGSVGVEWLAVILVAPLFVLPLKVRFARQCWGRLVEEWDTNLKSKCGGEEEI